MDPIYFGHACLILAFVFLALSWRTILKKKPKPCKSPTCQGPLYPGGYCDC